MGAKSSTASGGTSGSGVSPQSYQGLLTAAVMSSLAPTATTSAAGVAGDAAADSVYIPRELVLIIVGYVPPPALTDWDSRLLWPKSIRAPDEVKCHKCGLVFVLPPQTAVDAGRVVSSLVASNAAPKKTATGSGGSGGRGGADKKHSSDEKQQVISVPAPALRYAPTESEVETGKAVLPNHYSNSERFGSWRTVAPPDYTPPARTRPPRVVSPELYPCKFSGCGASFTDAARPANRRQLLWSALVAVEHDLSDPDLPRQFASLEAARALWSVSTQHSILLNPSLDDAERAFKALEQELFHKALPMINRRRYLFAVAAQ